ncbi:MAG: MarR family transcriptional regulator [Clostridiales bacterium]|nr:MarR family transcriptional regulator [Clostridiales bacterium]
MDDSIPLLLKRISIRMHQRADAEMKKDGLTFEQVRVLGCLRANGGSATQKTVEAHLDVAHPTVVGLVSRLQRNGFITVSVDPEDRRNRLLTLTARADEGAARAAKRRNRLNEELMRGFTDQERKTLQTLLTRILNNLDPGCAVRTGSAAEAAEEGKE